jgi:hypothetical protein
MFDLRDLMTQPELNLGLPRPELTPEEQQLAEVVEAAITDAQVTSGKLVVVAISSSEIALHDMMWGEVTLNEDGSLEWGFHENLMGIKPTGPFAVPDENKTFTSGEPPTKQIGLQDEDEAVGDDPSDV